MAIINISSGWYTFKPIQTPLFIAVASVRAMPPAAMPALNMLHFVLTAIGEHPSSISAASCYSAHAPPVWRDLASSPLLAAGAGGKLLVEGDDVERAYAACDDGLPNLHA